MTELRDESGRKVPRVEGLAFDSKGDLYVLPEDAGALLRFKRS